MSTRFKEPKTINYINYDGWIFPDDESPELKTDHVQEIRDYEAISDPDESFEAQQGIFGKYRHFYHNKIATNFKKQCLNICLTHEALATRNLNQGDKACVRECLYSLIDMQQSTNRFIGKQRSNVKMEDLAIPLDNLK